MYQPEYKYTSSTILVANVMNKIPSYFESGIIDESLLFKALKSGLDRMGHKIMPIREAYIKIEDKQGILPKDFFKAIKLIGCNVMEFYDIENPYQTRITERSIIEIPVCKSVCNSCTDECGNVYEMMQEFDAIKVKSKEYFEVKVDSSNKDICEGDLCYNDSPYTVSLKNGKIYANFTGYIYIEYLANLETCEDFLVPDYTQITDWLENLMMIECFEKIYLNGDGDVIQRLQFLNGKAINLEAIARGFWKQVEMQEVHDLKKILRNRYAFYKNIVNPNYKSPPYNIR